MIFPGNLTQESIADQRSGLVISRQWLNFFQNTGREAATALSQSQTALSPAPATATSPGTPGQIAYDATHFYWCIATNSWVRVTGAAW